MDTKTQNLERAEKWLDRETHLIFDDSGAWPVWCHQVATGAIIAAVRAEQERIANQFYAQYGDASWHGVHEIGLSEAQAFLDTRQIHNGVPEPPR